MTTTVVTSKGQVVIPVTIRKHLKIKKGTRFSIFEQDHRIVLQPLSKEFFASMAGMVKTKKSLTGLLLAERVKEKKREDSGWRA